MKKGKYTDKEYDIMDKIKRENKKLKKELKAARKMLDRYVVAEKVGLFDGEKVLPSKKRRKEKDVYEQWKCYSCENGTMQICIFGSRYLRICSGCGRRTKSKIIHSELSGIKNGEVYKGGK